jgi:hypothetical protein
MPQRKNRQRSPFESSSMRTLLEALANDGRTLVSLDFIMNVPSSTLPDEALYIQYCEFLGAEVPRQNPRSSTSSHDPEYAAEAAPQKPVPPISEKFFSLLLLLVRKALAPSPEAAGAKVGAKDFCGIIFVTQRLHGYLLHAFFTAHKAICDIRSAPLCGHGMDVMSFRFYSQIPKEGMGVLDQIKTLHAFKVGKVNLLISTKAGEEGLDVQTCHLVIMYSQYDTIVEYIQSRGRARDDLSEYYVFAPKGGSSLEFIRSANLWLQR